MTEELKQYEKSIKRKYSFNWTPKYEEEFRTDLNQTVFIPIVIKTFEELGWELVYEDETNAEARREESWGTSEQIVVSFDYGKVKVKSVSLGNEIWDNGRNSKRVKLFIHAIQQTEKEFDRQALVELEKEIEKTNNWDDYEIPKSLPQPKERREPKFWIPIIGGVITSLLLGFLIAFLSVKAVYIIGVFEFIVAVLIAFALKKLVEISNYTLFDNLYYLLIVMIIITYVSNQYFQYHLMINGYQETFSFWEFLKLRFDAGLTIKELNTGWIGLLVSWALQFIITYFVSLLRFSSNLIAYQLERVPIEVVNFAFYHSVKDKTEDQVRAELTKMGWIKEQDQNDVFESIGAIGSLQIMSESERIE